MIDTKTQVHRLKTWSRWWDRVHFGEKTFELRKDDRDFQVGDIVILVELEEESGKATGNELVRRITYVLRHDFERYDPADERHPLAGLNPRFCIFGMEPVDDAP